jgi:hypothetical protein
MSSASPRRLFALLCLLPALPAGASQLDEKSGLALAPGFEVVSVQCTVCHSARLITQNRASREGWQDMIRWMQETQGLWPLGEQEGLVLDYLAANYGTLSVGRRRPLPPELMPPP